jgi:hypothetical protein
MDEKTHPLAGEPFGFRSTKDGRVLLLHKGRVVKTLTGRDAARFLVRMETPDPMARQLVMAKATGRFKFGNERSTRAKP